MPVWLQVFIVVALSTILALQAATVLNARQPAADPEHDELLFLLRELAQVFRGWPDAFGVLDEIVAQFRTNTGHSMRDILDRLEKAAIVAATGAETAAAAAEASATAVSRVLTVTTLNAATGLRIEEHAAGVAADLDASHARADVVVGRAGEAADAASRSPEAPST